MADRIPCVVCGNEAGLICPCEDRVYCTRQCQVFDWGKSHFKVCMVGSTPPIPQSNGDKLLERKHSNSSRASLVDQITMYSRPSQNHIHAQSADNFNTDAFNCESVGDQSLYGIKSRYPSAGPLGYRRLHSESEQESPPTAEFTGLSIESKRRFSESGGSHRHDSGNFERMSHPTTRFSSSHHDHQAMPTKNPWSASMSSETKEVYASLSSSMIPSNVHESKNRTVRTAPYYLDKANPLLYRRDSAVSSMSSSNGANGANGACMPRRSHSSLSSHSIDSLIDRPSDDKGHGSHNPHHLMSKRDSAVSLCEDTRQPISRVSSFSIDGGMLSRRKTEPSFLTNEDGVSRSYHKATHFGRHASAPSIPEVNDTCGDKVIEKQSSVSSTNHSQIEESEAKGSNNLAVGNSGCERGMVVRSESKMKVSTSGEDSAENRLFLDPLTRRYPCQWAGCEKRFVRRGHMQSHLRTHTGEKPFACNWPECKSRFGQMGDLGRHMITHTGERPYPCTWAGCNKRFTTNQSKNRHFRIHTNTKKTHQCGWRGCVKRFSTKHSLKIHARRHTMGFDADAGSEQLQLDWEGSVEDDSTYSRSITYPKSSRVAC
eukprot:CFRG8145T1